ncbi:MAG: BcpO-related WXXGXW repeat protein [Proteobacteria bacterium]|nr:BcpO-related WXXGXW repeat protein [Pseudomonadota bacterium]
MSDDLKPDQAAGRRWLLRRLALLGLGGAGLAAGFAIDASSPADAQGYPPIPPPRYEAVPPPPGVRYAWQPGHWRWNGFRYVWFPGRYVPRGPRYAHFVPGHWARRYGQWVWVPQHWN